MLNLIKFKKSIAILSRKKKLKHFYSLFQEGQSVLDVGVSSETSMTDHIKNFFLKNYTYDPKTYTGLGIQDLGEMEQLFPGKRFVQYPGGRFPFLDKEFDWVFSNAVIEHVGIYSAQLHFVNEMMRVAKNVFFTTPNKYFFFESHTNLLFLHWCDKLFWNYCDKKKKWLKHYQLNLLSYKQLKNLLKNSRAKFFRIHKNYTFFRPMTFTVICRDH